MFTHHRRLSLVFLALAAHTFLPACTGEVGIANPTSPATGVPDDDPPVVDEVTPTAIPEASSCLSGSAPGPRALRRLSAGELAATLKDLFGDAAVPLTSIFSDPMVLGFSNDAHFLVVRGLGAQQIMDQAESVAHWAVTTHMSSISPCTSNDATCRQSFIRSFGKRAHRAPLGDDDVARYEQIFAAEGTFADGTEAVISAMLQSPYFLYRRELGTPTADGFELSPYEVASNLSYFLTGSMPDPELMAAAESGALATASEVDRQTERLLQTPGGHAALDEFMSGWLGLQKLATVAKDDSVFKLTPSLRAAMAHETSRLVEDVFYNQRGSLVDLLTTSRTFVNSELASHYGLPGASTMGTQLTPVTLAAATRDFGLLAHGSMMTAYATSAESSPVQRGKLVRMRFLCQDLPPPPANLNTMLKPPNQATTTREHFAEHSKNAVCASCHTRMDPIGFGFEHYDAFGRRRDTDGGKPVDATGSIVDGPGGNVSFDGVGGLASYLTTTARDEVTSCMIRYWSYFAFGSLTWNEDQCTYDAIARQAAVDRGSLQSVVKAITHTTRFNRRTADR